MRFWRALKCVGKCESEILQSFNVRGLSFSLRKSYCSRPPVAYTCLTQSLVSPGRSRLLPLSEEGWQHAARKAIREVCIRPQVVQVTCSRTHLCQSVQICLECQRILTHQDWESSFRLQGIIVGWTCAALTVLVLPPRQPYEHLSQLHHRWERLVLAGKPCRPWNKDVSLLPAGKDREPAAQRGRCSDATSSVALGHGTILRWECDWVVIRTPLQEILD